MSINLAKRWRVERTMVQDGAQRGVPNRAGDIAQSVKCLPCKHEDLSAIPRTHVKTPGGVGYGSAGL